MFRYARRWHDRCPFPGALTPATSTTEKVSFRQINKETGNRIRYKKVDADTDEEVSAFGKCESQSLKSDSRMMVRRPTFRATRRPVRISS
jgi:non-homologous end joining protein Ku